MILTGYINKCNNCGNVIYHIPFVCKYCLRKHCDKCKLPENHNCISLPKERIITFIESINRVNKYKAILDWTSLPIKLLAIISLTYFLVSFSFFSLGTTTSYITGTIYAGLSLLLIAPIYTFFGIRIDYKQRLNLLDFNFNFKGKWKYCEYTETEMPEDCRSCLRCC